jgi:membrane dipeptidase
LMKRNRAGRALRRQRSSKTSRAHEGSVVVLALLLSFACASSDRNEGGAGDGSRDPASSRGEDPTANPARDATTPPRPEGISEEAWRIHRSAIVVDGHNDLPWAMREKAAYSLEKKDLSKPQAEFDTDIPRLRAGGVGAQFWSVYVPVDAAKKGAALHETLEQIEFVKRMAKRYPETFAMAGTADDVERIRATGRIACLLGAEGGHSMEASIAVLRMLRALGVRYMTLAHSDTNEICDSATDEPKWGGLSPFGEEVVAEMNRLGMLVDISHVSVETMEDALRVSKAPVIASHSSCFALAPHPRNVPDEVLRKVRENGGVLMVNFYSGFVVESSARKMAGMFGEVRKMREKYPDEKELEAAIDAWRKANPIEQGTVKTLVDHIDHAVKVAGIDCVGLGSDFDGITETPVGLEDVSSYPRITQEMLERGYSEEEIRKVLGGNAMRVLRRAEEVAEELGK